MNQFDSGKCSEPIDMATHLDDAILQEKLKLQNLNQTKKQTKQNQKRLKQITKEKNQNTRKTKENYPG